MPETTKVRVGKRELEILSMLGTPTSILVTPDRLSDRLVSKGLARTDEHRGVCITPAGLRHLATAIETGALKDGLDLARERRERAN